MKLSPGTALNDSKRQAALEDLLNGISEDEDANHATPSPDIIKSNRRLIADPKVPAKARILRQKCHLRQNSVNCEM